MPKITHAAMECMGYSYGDIPENAPEPTDELMNAIALLREAEDRALEKENRLNMLDRDLRAAKYTLFEKYSQMIEEALCDKNVSSWDARREKETLTQKELMQLLNIKSSEQES